MSTLVTILALVVALYTLLILRRMLKQFDHSSRQQLPDHQDRRTALEEQLERLDRQPLM